MASSAFSAVTFPGENGPSAASSRPASKLEKSAEEFEAILLQSWLDKMNQSFVGAGESQDAAHDTVSSLGTQAIASALAARGGIGIAAMLLRQLQPADRSVHPGLENFAAPKTGLAKAPSR